MASKVQTTSKVFQWSKTNGAVDERIKGAKSGPKCGITSHKRLNPWVFYARRFKEITKMNEEKEIEGQLALTAK